MDELLEIMFYLNLFCLCIIPHNHFNCALSKNCLHFKDDWMESKVMLLTVHFTL